MKAIVVGGGIGGLTAAIALRQAGIGVEVWERSPAIREVGAGVSLWANAVKVLDKLNAGEALRKHGEKQGSGGLRNWRGVKLSHIEMDALEKMCGAITVFIHRAELIELLYQHAGRECVHLGADLASFDQEDKEVRVLFADGRETRGDILIGADGLKSRVRQTLFPGSAPRYAGYTCVRGIVHFPHPDWSDWWGESWGPGVRFGLAPMYNDRICWWAVWNAPPGEIREPAQRKAKALELARGWHSPLSEVIERTDPDVVIQNDIFDITPLKTWSQGRVTLMGDAAHAMQPNLGQGACQAIEDAYVLAKCLRERPDYRAALGTYERWRIPHTTKAIVESDRFGKVGQLENKFLCWVRDTMARITPGKLALRPMLHFAKHEVI